MKNKFIIILFYIFFIEPSAAEINNLESKIFKNLRCIVCQGQSIAESNSDFAQTIKIVVRDKIDQGDNEKEIYEFLAEKYGANSEAVAGLVVTSTFLTTFTTPVLQSFLLT